MHKFLYDYLKKKIGDKAHLCDIDIDRFIIYIKTKDFHKIVKNDGEKRFHTSPYKTFTNRKNKKVVGMMKGDFGGGEIMKELIGLRLKMYSYKKDNDKKDKKATVPKKGVIKDKMKFQNYKNCLKAE